MLYLHNILYGVWAIEPSFAQSLVPLVVPWIKTGVPPQNDARERNQQPAPISASYNQSGHRIVNAGWRFDPAEYGDEDLIAVFNIDGAITKHDQFCGPDGMSSHARRLKQCYNAKNVKGAVLHIESGGGEGNAARLLSETLALRNIPVVAFCDDFACSAAYDIASATDRVVANAPTARLGSIGTYLTVVDFTKQLEMEGINVKEIYADQSSDKNRDYYEAISGNNAPLKAVANRYNNDFLARIRTNRPAAVKNESSWNTGKVFFADEALSLGLIDAIDTLDNVFNYFS